jgi:hypothetical protein
MDDDDDFFSSSGSGVRLGVTIRNKDILNKAPSCLHSISRVELLNQVRVCCVICLLFSVSSVHFFSSCYMESLWVETTIVVVVFSLSVHEVILHLPYFLFMNVCLLYL